MLVETIFFPEDFPSLLFNLLHVPALPTCIKCPESFL